MRHREPKQRLLKLLGRGYLLGSALVSVHEYHVHRVREYELPLFSDSLLVVLDRICMGLHELRQDVVSLVTIAIAPVKQLLAFLLTVHVPVNVLFVLAVERAEVRLDWVRGGELVLPILNLLALVRIGLRIINIEYFTLGLVKLRFEIVARHKL